jgi:uncharacterized protein with LGFP repeats
MSAIDDKYNSLGGTNGVLGPPADDETECADKVGRFRRYTNGAIYWTPTLGAHAVYGLIYAKWASLGLEKGPNAYPISDESDAGSGKGSRYNSFQDGTVIWKNGATQAFSVHGAIWTKWGQLGYDSGSLGFPITDETATPDGKGRFNHFEGGSIYWTLQTGAHFVKGPIRDAWAAQGWERGKLQYPVSDELITETNDEGRSQRFEGGLIRWTPEGGAQISYAVPL